MSLKAILLAVFIAGVLSPTSACSLRHITSYGPLIVNLNDSLPQDYNFPVTVLPVRCQNFSDIAMLKSSLTHLHSMAGKQLKPKVLQLLEQIQFENCSALDKFDGSGFEVQFWNTSYFVAQLFITLNNFNDCHMNGRICPAWPEKRSCLPTDSSTATVTQTGVSYKLMTLTIIVIVIVLISIILVLSSIVWKRRSQHRPPAKSDNEETAETESLRAVTSV